MRASTPPPTPNPTSTPTLDLVAAKQLQAELDRQNAEAACPETAELDAQYARELEEAEREALRLEAERTTRWATGGLEVRGIQFVL